MDGTMVCTVCGRVGCEYSNQQLKRMRTSGVVAVCIDCCMAKQATRSVGKSAWLEAATAEVTADAHPLRPRVFLEDPQSLYLLDWVVPAGGIPLQEEKECQATSIAPARCAHSQLVISDRQPNEQCKSRNVGWAEGVRTAVVVDNQREAAGMRGSSCAI
jgi:hypothetical protein